MEKQNNKAAYIAAAKSLFNNTIQPNFSTYMAAGNIWRTTWALDTLTNYFLAVDSSNAASFAQSLLTNSLLDATNGFWWDDYGWDGIACERAALALPLAIATRSTFIENAINCWCYMHGPGWKIGGEPNFTVPYPDICNWKTLLDQKKGDLGAANVFEYWQKNNSPTYWADLKPRFTPGGIWNTTDAPAQPTAKMNACGAVQELAGLQNTVTNATYTLLSNRLLALSVQPAYAHYFESKRVNTQEIYLAGARQLRWFLSWFQSAIPNASLLYDINPAFPDTSILIRERAPMMANGQWSAGYCHTLGWMGDQGLMIGALRESSLATHPAHPGERPDAALAATFGAIINGVMRSAWSKSGYTTSTAVLRPWVQYSGGQGTYDSYPAGDDADYQTGPAVFCSYLEQAMAIGYAPPPPLKAALLALADLILTGYFDANQYVSCDGFYSSGTSDSNGMTAPINQLAVLCLAVRLS